MTDSTALNGTHADRKVEPTVEAPPVGTTERERGSPPTSLDPEELAYPYGSLRQSRRRARVLCADGVVRSAVVGIPDTYFSIPARLKANGKTVTGFVSSDEIDGVVVYKFTAYTYGANHDAIKALA